MRKTVIGPVAAVALLPGGCAGVHIETAGADQVSFGGAPMFPFTPQQVRRRLDGQTDIDIARPEAKARNTCIGPDAAVTDGQASGVPKRALLGTVLCVDTSRERAARNPLPWTARRVRLAGSRSR